eukprot:COSAG02_NODE_3423_length_6770_cov_5.903912_3_plen_96_part_00
MEASFLLVQAITLALGGVFTFELVETSSLLGQLISVVLILVNFYTLLPLLRLVHDNLRERSTLYRNATTMLCARCAGNRDHDDGATDAPLLAGAE